VRSAVGVERSFWGTNCVLKQLQPVACLPESVTVLMGGNGAGQVQHLVKIFELCLSIDAGNRGPSAGKDFGHQARPRPFRAAFVTVPTRTSMNCVIPDLHC